MRNFAGKKLHPEFGSLNYSKINFPTFGWILMTFKRFQLENCSFYKLSPQFFYCCRQFSNKPVLQVHQIHYQFQLSFFSQTFILAVIASQKWLEGDIKANLNIKLKYRDCYHKNIVYVHNNNIMSGRKYVLKCNKLAAGDVFIAFFHAMCLSKQESFVVDDI